MIYFTKSHEWIQIKDKVGTVGISDYAQNELGEIVYVELPKVGDITQVGQEICVLESTKAAADIYAPVSGKIVAVNEELKTRPMVVNEHSQTSGWLFQIELSDSKQVEHLLSEKQYQALISS